MEVTDSIVKTDHTNVTRYGHQEINKEQIEILNTIVSQSTEQ